jgi:hypothetical protein
MAEETVNTDTSWNPKICSSFVLDPQGNQELRDQFYRAVYVQCVPNFLDLNDNYSPLRAGQSEPEVIFEFYATRARTEEMRAALERQGFVPVKTDEVPTHFPAPGNHSYVKKTTFVYDPACDQHLAPVPHSDEEVRLFKELLLKLECSAKKCGETTKQIAERNRFLCTTYGYDLQ